LKLKLIYVKTVSNSKVIERTNQKINKGITQTKHADSSVQTRNWQSADIITDDKITFKNAAASLR